MRLLVPQGGTLQPTIVGLSASRKHSGQADDCACLSVLAVRSGQAGRRIGAGLPYYVNPNAKLLYNSVSKKPYLSADEAG